MEQANFLDQAAPAERKGEYILPSGSTVEACRSCGAQIARPGRRAGVEARTANDKPIPLSLATVQRRDGVVYALPHFVDYPEAKDWSRR